MLAWKAATGKDVEKEYQNFVRELWEQVEFQDNPYKSEEECTAKANKLMNDGKSDEAVSTIQSCADFYPDVALMYWYKGEILQKKGLPCEAAQAYEKAKGLYGPETEWGNYSNERAKKASEICE